MIKAILFDMDGVLIDSMEANYFHFNSLLKHFGKRELDFEEYRKSHWGTHIHDDLKRIFGRISKEKFSEMISYYNKTSSKFVKDQKPYPGVKRVLRFLKRKYKLALVTSTLSKLTRRILQHFSLEEYFDVTIDGGMIKNPKPAPEAVLLACKKLKIKPSEAIYIGDNLRDVEAGKKAGCSVIGITTISTKRELKGADGIVNSLDELIDMIGNLDSTHVRL